jgi:HD-like signal output (HDOD) protein/ActR/RegA family two-component response regulator
MANILLLDDDPVAQKAMAGILGRAEHKFAAVSSVEDALKFILQNVAIDLFITDMRLNLSTGQPLNLVRLIRSNTFLKTMPVLVYTSVTGRENVRAALALRVQNYLLKPYSDAKVFMEIKRAEDWDWIKGHFDDPKSFCVQMNLTMDSWRLMMKELLKLLRDITPRFREVIEKRSLDPCAAEIGELIKASEACGFWTLYDLLNDLISAADKEQWIRVHSLVSSLSIADRFVMRMLEPDIAPDGFVDAVKFGLHERALPPDSWLREEVIAHCPLATKEETEKRLASLQSFPVFEGKAAAYRMAADGHGSSVQSVIDLVAMDPGLTALAIQKANKFSGDPDSPIEDSRQAVQMLGGQRLQDLASQFDTIPEESFDLAPVMDWHRFWMYQYGCAQVCSFVCEFMEIPIFLPHAYWVGMLHDMGKVALAKVYPESFAAAASMAAKRGISMDEAYENILGLTSREAGARVAASCGFPSEFINVMRHYKAPDDAVEDRELAAIVAFSSALCLRYGIGSNGEPPIPESVPLEKFPGWSIVRERVFPSFDLNRFADVMKDWSTQLCASLRGNETFVPD